MGELISEKKRISSLKRYIFKEPSQISGFLYEKSANSVVVLNGIDTKLLEKSREMMVDRYTKSILGIIAADEYVDGEISKSEVYMKEAMTPETKNYILEALMNIYLDNFNKDEHVLMGVMEMIACRKYAEVAPNGQMMALGLLQHKNIYLRDRAIQVYEQWNSKKGIGVLKGLKCDQKWLQDYVDKVIMYLEREGE